MEAKMLQDMLSGQKKQLMIKKQLKLFLCVIFMQLQSLCLMLLYLAIFLLVVLRPLIYWHRWNVVEKRGCLVVLV